MAKKCCGGADYSLQKEFETCCVGIAGATVNVAGQIIRRCGDTNFNIVRLSTGRYDITPPSGAAFAHIEALEGDSTSDSISIHMGTSFTGGTAWIGEGDNGTSDNVPRDRPFSIIWYGDKEVLKDATLLKGETPLSNRPMWAGQFDEPDIHQNNQVINMQQVRSDVGWSQSAAGVQYTGSPDYVEIQGHIYANSTGNYWANPIIEVQRNGVGIARITVLFMDTNGTYSGDASADIAFKDPTPGINPEYRFVSFVNDNRTMNDPTLPSLSPISLQAYL